MKLAEEPYTGLHCPECESLVDWRCPECRIHSIGYTHPPAKQEPLTEEEIDGLWDAVAGAKDSDYITATRAIESACAKKWGVNL